jgi:predicted amidohydrolase YtcJ
MAILFLNGTVIDGNGGLTERGALLTKAGTIEAVGSTASLVGRRNDPDGDHSGGVERGSELTVARGGMV